VIGGRRKKRKEKKEKEKRPPMIIPLRARCDWKFGSKLEPKEKMKEEKKESA